MVKIIRTYYSTYDITWSSEPVWVWTGIEAHMAVVLASVPALNHFFRRTLKDTSISSRLKTFTHRRYESGYDRTQSQSDSEIKGSTQHDYVNENKAIHVVQEVHLEESLRDKSYDLRPGQGRGVNIDEEAMQKDRRAWLDDGTSDDNSNRNYNIK
jgi:hypothetical protein